LSFFVFFPLLKKVTTVIASNGNEEVKRGMVEEESGAPKHLFGPFNVKVSR